MSREDMILLIKAGDALYAMGNTLEVLTGTTYADGEYKELDYVYEVIYHNSHRYYSECLGKHADDDFWKILSNKELGVEERADLLLGRNEAI